MKPDHPVFPPWPGAKIPRETIEDKADLLDCGCAVSEMRLKLKWIERALVESHVDGDERAEVLRKILPDLIECRAELSALITEAEESR
jgi:hypothetical protein